MIVYHGSNVFATHPDTEHSFRSLDFGKGFYVTTVKEQAERWARRKVDIYGTDKAIVTVYNISEDLNGLVHKCFEDDLAEWIDFVCNSRDGKKDYLKYDLIKRKAAIVPVLYRYFIITEQPKREPLHQEIGRAHV